MLAAFCSRGARVALLYALVSGVLALGAGPALSQAWKDAPAYARDRADNVLRRSVFFMPLFGATFPEKFEVLLASMPAGTLRGVVVYNHGCGGQWGWETTVAQFLYRQGFAVITPEFSARMDNKLGCSGSTEEESRRSGAERAREGVYQAINPARLAARADDILAVVAWLKARTSLPIVVGGHSEGCRSTYTLQLSDPQVVGGICVKQGLQDSYEHTWRWNPEVPMWQSLEQHDPWVMWGRNTIDTVGFERKFTQHPGNLTVVRVPGKTHDPLNHADERASLTAWLNRRVPQPLVPGANGFVYESALPRIQQQLQSPR